MKVTTESAVHRATLQTSNTSEPEEDTFPEGRLPLPTALRLRERNQKVIDKAKAIEMKRKSKLCCSRVSVRLRCRIYGKLGDDFIEGHHTSPLAYREGKTETSVSDIALVCSNCHRMLHRRRPWLNIDQLQVILAKKT